MDPWTNFSPTHWGPGTLESGQPIPHSLGLSSSTFFNFSPSFFSYLHLLLSFFSLYILCPHLKPHSPNQPTTMLASSSTLQPHALSSSSPLLPKLPRTLPLFSPLLRSSTRLRPNLIVSASADGETTHRVIEEQTGTGKRRGNEGIVNTGERREEEDLMEKRHETFLYSVAPYPLLFAAALPGASTVRSIFEPFVELVKTWNLPDWLVHWGHPGNMAVVLFAMGGYGTYLGFRIRFSDNAEEKAMAKDLHPKLLAGMFFFFALGATGGVTALLTSDKPILESPHAITGLIGLSLLTVQTILPALFEGNPGLRTVHGLLGSSIMTLFLVHAALGLQLGLSF